MTMTRIHGLAAAAALTVLAACGQMDPKPMQAMASGPTAVATLTPTTGNSAAGTVTFQQHGDHVMVVGKVSGLKPNQEHGFHAHEKGDCSSGDGMTTGGHFNPTAKPHGKPDAEHHAGDMPALKSDANGSAQARFTLSGVTVGRSEERRVGK